jgi:hypothetical protein
MKVGQRAKPLLAENILFHKAIDVCLIWVFVELQDDVAKVPFWGFS